MSKAEDPVSEIDTVDVTESTTRTASPKEARELAIRENITIQEAYSKLLGVEVGE